MSQRYEHQGGAQRTTLVSTISDSATSIVITAATNWPTGASYPFWIVIDRGLATEEKILCSSRSGTTVTVSSRGADGTAAQAHTAGAYVEHVLVAVEVDDLNDKVAKLANETGGRYATSTTAAVGLQTTGESQPRFKIRADGLIEIGSGSAVPDTNLYRSTANTLKTDDALNVAGAVDIDSTLNVDGAATFGSTVTATGAVTGSLLKSNAGTPESVVTAGVGAVCHDTTNGAVYVKESGTGNTGWRLMFSHGLADAAGDLFYGSADNTVTRLPIGTSLQVLTVSGGLPAWVANSAATIVDSAAVETAVTNTTTETTLWSKSVTGATFAAGDVARLFLWGEVENDSGGAVVVTFRVKIGATTVFSDATINVLDAAATSYRQPWTIECLVAVQGTTDQETSYRSGYWLSGALDAGSGTARADGAVGDSRGSNSIAEDMSTTLTWAVTAQWASAHATTSCRIHGAVLTKE